MPLPLFTKDPGDNLDFTVDLSQWLATGDTVSTATWMVPAGLTKTNESLAAGKATVWLDGGTVGTTYTVTCVAVTAQGREKETSIQIRVRQQ